MPADSNNPNTRVGAMAPDASTSPVGHTPGPWMATRSLHDTRVVICTEHGHRIDVATTYAAGCGVPVEANARLIAAAPELLEALVEALANIKAREEALAGEEEFVERARAAIAKAHGTAPTPEVSHVG